MYLLGNLKPEITVTEAQVECPVKGCSYFVERQRRSFRREQRFQCPEHGIFISPSTFEYPKETDNLLWIDPDDRILLKAIKGAKRESRMSRDNSEDALSWNVFRFLEKEKQLAPLLSPVIGNAVSDPELIYWSYSPNSKKPWPELDMARLEFGENLQRSSEPDLIVVTDDALFFIEAKLTAGNKTRPSNPGERKRYLTGGVRWFDHVFSSEYEDIVLKSEKYELFRFWLLGTWMAERSGRSFYLVNLVRDGYEKDIETLFGRHIQQTDRRRFMRWTWEEIYRFIPKNVPVSPGKTMVMDYFENKTVGYYRGFLQKAFNIISI